MIIHIGYPCQKDKFWVSEGNILMSEFLW